jgi:hypothetical protein
MSQSDVQNVEHLTSETWKALLAEPKAHPGLFEHVQAGCDVCDAFLATTFDELDGAVDRALLSLRPQYPQPLDELGWMRLRKRLGLRSKSSRLIQVVGALAAALIAVVAFEAVQHRDTGWNGLKGVTSNAPSLSLQVALKQRDNTFLRLDEGSHVAPTSVMVFRATSSIDGPARVFLQRGESPAFEVGQTEVRAGTFDLQNDNGLLGVTLENEHGDISVWVVAGEGPFAQAAAIAAITAKTSNDLALARVRLHVE